MAHTVKIEAGDRFDNFHRWILAQTGAARMYMDLSEHHDKYSSVAEATINAALNNAPATVRLDVRENRLPMRVLATILKCIYLQDELWFVVTWHDYETAIKWVATEQTAVIWPAGTFARA